jgi:hypothetical protein
MCWSLGDGTVARDDKQAQVLLQRACDGSYGMACFTLALAKAAGEDRPADKVKEQALMDKACAAGLGMGCTDPAKALEHRARGCERGDTDDCVWLLDVDPALERRLVDGLVERYGAACDAGDMGVDGCVGLGSLYIYNVTGSWKPRDEAELRARAFEPLRKACAADFFMGCQQLYRLETGNDDVAARARAACSIPSACGRQGKADVQDDPPLADAPGSTRLLDELRARALDPHEDKEARFEAAEGVERMGHPELVADVLEWQRVAETYHDLVTYEKQLENEVYLQRSAGRRLNAEILLALGQAAINGSRRKVDAWDREFVARVVPAADAGREPTVEIRSLGPDGREGTSDDLSTLEHEWEYLDRRLPQLFRPRKQP